MQLRFRISREVDRENVRFRGDIAKRGYIRHSCNFQRKVMHSNRTVLPSETESSYVKSSKFIVKLVVGKIPLTRIECWELYEELRKEKTSRERE